PPPPLHSFPTRRSSDLTYPFLPLDPTSRRPGQPVENDFFSLTRNGPGRIIADATQAATGISRRNVSCAGEIISARGRNRLYHRRSEEHTSELQSLAYLV